MAAVLVDKAFTESLLLAREEFIFLFGIIFYVPAMQAAAFEKMGKGFFGVILIIISFAKRKMKAAGFFIGQSF